MKFYSKDSNNKPSYTSFSYTTILYGSDQQRISEYIIFIWF